MAGTNPRTDPFYAGDLNATLAEYTATSAAERYWDGGERPSYLSTTDSINDQTAQLLAALDADQTELIDSINNDDFTTIERTTE